MTILMAGITQVLEQVRELGSRFGVETFWNLGGSGVYAAQLAHTHTLQGSRYVGCLIKCHYQPVTQKQS